MTALWASVAGPAGAGAAASPPADRAGAGDDACEAWWTADERYVLRVAAAGGERWYVGELEADEAGEAVAAGAGPAGARPSGAGIPAVGRTMLVGRQRGRRAAPAPMRLHVQRPPRG